MALWWPVARLPRRWRCANSTDGLDSGLLPENHSPDGNLNIYRLLRYAGFGALNRTATLAFYIGGGAYVIPTGYTTPLAV